MMRCLLILITVTLLSACSSITFIKREKELKPEDSETLVKELETVKAVDLAKERKNKELIASFCSEVKKSFHRYGWGRDYCEEYLWQVYDEGSVKERGLLFHTFGEWREGDASQNVTLIMCGVHGDEITPIKFCFDTIRYLKKTEQADVSKLLDDKFVIIAPIVSPDSYFKKWPSRTNARGVDINRNFPTKDFDALALKAWRERYKKDKRRFPGKIAASEPETRFQVELIEKYRPKKIVSVHAPLTLLDYDGPADRHTGGIEGSRANQLLIQMSAKAKGYRIKNYPFFPGSLGNWAGNERDIPTFTLELPSSDNRKHRHFWKLFKNSIHSAINYDLRQEIDVAQE